MREFTKNLRLRVDELGISLAEAARRCDLSERRFANYASGSREPDLATLVRIADRLDTTPDELLGVKVLPAAKDDKTRLRRQLAADTQTLNASALQLVVGLVRTVIEHER